MKNVFQRIKLPAFMRNARVITIFAIIAGLALATIILSFFNSFWIGLALTILFLAMVVSIYYAAEVITQDTQKYVSDLTYRIKRGEQEALIQMPIGILLYNDHKEIQWTNPFFQQYIGKKDILGKTLDNALPDLGQFVAKYSGDDSPHQIKWGDNQFDMTVQDDLGVIYLLDITKYAKIEDQLAAQQVAIGQVFLDNYDEITQSMDDQAISNMNNYVTNKLTDWANHYHMFLKRVDDDHFFVMAYMARLQEAEHDKFKILDVIRQDTSKQNYPLTLSIGFAYGNPNLATLANDAQSNLDLALGRGGDQVVVKAPDSPARFFGGRTNPMEKRTRVRARMISQALQEIFKQVDKIYVMGHARPDMDAIGASLGIRRIAEMNGKECDVIVNANDVHSDVQRLLHRVEEQPEVAKHILTPTEALNQVTDKTLLILVDHSKPSISISPELCQRLSQRLIVIDHHRRGEEFPENPMLVYIEPYASSTCELITEMFEYQPKNVPGLSKLEATAMLAGITVDTHSFSLRTGTRTFDAASYLRSVGADSTLVQELLKEDVNNFIQKNHLIETIEMVEPNMALCTGEEDEVYDPVVAAQAADTLLSLAGIEASFVIVKRIDGVIGISARSLGKVNVQVIMEKMGGGGHLSNAATQIKDSTIAQARQQLKDILTQLVAADEE